MMCAWKELLGILPPRFRREVDNQGREGAQALRLRINSPPELILNRKSLWLTESATREDLLFVVNSASQYSPWAAATTAKGYLTAPGGHRIGLCGEAINQGGKIIGMREVYSLCIRIARDFPGIGLEAAQCHGSVLILGAPGWGKTTLLRDLIRQRSKREWVSVIDERGELFPEGFDRGCRTDILTGCPKPEGLDMTLRTMGPSCIALDEITAEEDCAALVQASNCGVHLLATAHASKREDLAQRPIYRMLAAQNLFETVIILHPDKSYHMERMAL